MKIFDFHSQKFKVGNPPFSCRHCPEATGQCVRGFMVTKFDWSRVQSEVAWRLGAVPCLNLNPPLGQGQRQSIPVGGPTEVGPQGGHSQGHTAPGAQCGRYTPQASRHPPPPADGVCPRRQRWR